MIVVEIKGGLGNQLYQYLGAYFAWKQRAMDEEIFLDTSFYENMHIFQKRTFGLDCFDIPCKLYTGEKNLLVPIEYEEHSDLSQVDFFQGENILLPGYYIAHQHIEQYLKDCIDVIKPNLELLNPSDEYFEVLEKIRQASNAVIVHIRHGNCVIERDIFLHGVVKKDYYLQQIKNIKEKFSDCHFFFFTDTNNFLEREYGDIPNSTFVHLDDTHADILEFELMRYGVHYIIPNSTFSQLPALLNYRNDPNKQVYIPRVHVKSNYYANDASTFLTKGWNYIEEEEVFAELPEIEYYAHQYYEGKYVDRIHNSLVWKGHLDILKNELEKEYDILNEKYIACSNNKWYYFGQMKNSQKILFLIKKIIKKLLLLG